MNLLRELLEVTTLAEHPVAEAKSAWEDQAEPAPKLKLKPGRWQSELDISEAWGKAGDDEITVQELAQEVAKKLKALNLSHLVGKEYEHLTIDRDDLVDEFESFGDDESGDKDDFDSLTAELYDWADQSVGLAGRKLCWVKTF